MRITLLGIITIIFALISCSKELPGLQDQQQVSSLSFKQQSPLVEAIKIKPITWTEEYNSIMYDSCRQENITLTGTVDYSLYEDLSETGFNARYVIILDKITGISESGIVYKGGGRIDHKTNAAWDKDTKARYSYKVRYRSEGGNHIDIIESGMFIETGGVIRKQTLESSLTCK